MAAVLVAVLCVKTGRYLRENRSGFAYRLPVADRLAHLVDVDADHLTATPGAQKPGLMLSLNMFSTTTICQDRLRANLKTLRLEDKAGIAPEADGSEAQQPALRRAHHPRCRELRQVWQPQNHRIILTTTTTTAAAAVSVAVCIAVTSFCYFSAAFTA
jgi:hypothetical protein